MCNVEIQQQSEFEGCIDGVRDKIELFQKFHEQAFK